MSRNRRISTGTGVATLLAASVISALTTAFGLVTTSSLLQTAGLLVSMGLLFYSSHPLGHYFVARMFGVHVDYFFVGKSDFRKLKMKPMRTIGNSLPTIGTKLNKSKLESLAPQQKGYIFGSGVILSSALMGIQLGYASVAGFNFLALLLGAILFVGTIVLEFVFSTKVGDLSKMRHPTS